MKKRAMMAEMTKIFFGLLFELNINDMSEKREREKKRERKREREKKREREALFLCLKEAEVSIFF